MKKLDLKQTTNQTMKLILNNEIFLVKIIKIYIRYILNLSLFLYI